MRFTTLLSAAAAIGFAGVLALGTTTTANASSSLASDRVQGPFALFIPGHSGANKYMGYVSLAPGSSPKVAVVTENEQEAASASSTFTFPAPGTSGPIIDAKGYCLTAASITQYPIFSRECSGAANQNFVVGTDGALTTSGGLKVTSNVSVGQDLITEAAAGSTLRLPVSLLIPIVAVANLDAQVVSVDTGAKTAVVGGTGEPGATIEVEGPNGTVSTTVGSDGKWQVTLPGLTAGDNPIKVTQTAGPDVQTVDLVASVAVTDLDAQVVSVDADAKTAVVGGTGEPGAAIEVEGPNGTVSTTIGADGTWQVTVPGLTDGDNPIKVTQTVGTDVQTADLVVSVLASPIVAPSIAGGAGVAAFAALGTIFMVRRNRATA